MTLRNIGDHEKWDDLHQDLMKLLDKIETQEDPSLASERFDIMKSYGYKLKLLTGPTGIVKNGQ